MIKIASSFIKKFSIGVGLRGIFLAYAKASDLYVVNEEALEGSGKTYKTVEDIIFNLNKGKNIIFAGGTEVSWYGEGAFEVRR